MTIHLFNLATYQTSGNPLHNYTVLYTSVLSVQCLYYCDYRRSPRCLEVRAG